MKNSEAEIKYYFDFSNNIKFYQKKNKSLNYLRGN